MATEASEGVGGYCREEELSQEICEDVWREKKEIFFSAGNVTKIEIRVALNCVTHNSILLQIVPAEYKIFPIKKSPIISSLNSEN